MTSIRLSSKALPASCRHRSSPARRSSYILAVRSSRGTPSRHSNLQATGPPLRLARAYSGGQKFAWHAIETQQSSGHRPTPRESPRSRLFLAGVAWHARHRPLRCKLCVRERRVEDARRATGCSRRRGEAGRARRSDPGGARSHESLPGHCGTRVRSRRSALLGGRGSPARACIARSCSRNFPTASCTAVAMNVDARAPSSATLARASRPTARNRRAASSSRMDKTARTKLRPSSA